MAKKKIKILHHSNQFGIGGTEKDMLLFCKYFDRDVFEVHAIARKYPVPPHREILTNIKSALGSSKAKILKAQHQTLRIRIPEFLEIVGDDFVHFYTPGNLPAKMRELSPTILHVHHSGNPEPPIAVPEAVNHIPIIFTINGFGFEDPTPQGKKVTRILFPSNYIWDKVALWAKNDARCGMLYCPIEKSKSKENLRREMGIAADTVVFGRVGRNANDIHDPISLKAYKKVESDKTLFLALAPPPVMVQEAKDLGIKNIRWLDPTVDEVWLSKFYNTIDVLAHARNDGETFGCVIAEAMIHGRTVVSHHSFRDAQAELLEEGKSGFVVERHNSDAYAEKMKLLVENKDLRLKMGQAAEKRALENFEAELITKKLEKMYFEELTKRNLLVN